MPVERTSGATEQLEVVRLGVFNAVSDGVFLDWDTSKSRDELHRTGPPAGGSLCRHGRGSAGRATGKVVPMAVDFTRGQILRAVVQTKTPLERVREDGGPVGYVIIAVGMLGLALCLWKFVSLYTTRQQNPQPDQERHGQPVQSAGPRAGHLRR